MVDASPTLRAVGAALAASGLVLRGAFHPKPEDAVPGAPGTLALVGNAGPEMWRVFAATRTGGRDPLDRWSRARIEAIARRFGARALFPFDGPPYLPFQRWATKADSVHISPLGMLIHPDYGLWHAYRGALAFRMRLPLPPPDRRPSPCASCTERPCLAACPADAFDGERYDVGACLAHIGGSAGDDCMKRGCRARRACPVGRAHAYTPEQAAFHMAAFFKAWRDG